MSAEPAVPLQSPAQADIPRRFLTVRVLELYREPSLTAVCAGYEGGQWRADDYALHLLDWIPDFALRQSERSVRDGNCRGDDTAGHPDGVRQQVIGPGPHPGRDPAAHRVPPGIPERHRDQQGLLQDRGE